MKPVELHILYDMQLSATTDSVGLRGASVFERDSNVDVARTLIAGLVARHPNWRFYVSSVPHPLQTVPQGSAAEVVSGDPRVKHLRDPYWCSNPYVERFRFSPASLISDLGKVGAPRIDVVMANDPCKVLALKTTVHKYNHVTGVDAEQRLPRVMTRFHWLTGQTDRKRPAQLDFAIRQVEGALHSDWVTFNSMFACDLFYENAREFFNPRVVGALKRRCAGFEQVDASRVIRGATSGRSIFDYVDQQHQKTRVIWAHRISYYTGWEEVFKMFDVAWSHGPQDFVVLVTDPTERIRGDSEKQAAFVAEHPWAVFPWQSWSVPDYYRACVDADVVIGNHTYRTIWGGYAVTEPMAAACAPLLPRRDSYVEMFRLDRRHAWFSDIDELRAGFDRYRREPLTRDLYGRAAQDFCFDALSTERFIDRFERVLVDWEAEEAFGRAKDENDDIIDVKEA